MNDIEELKNKIRMARFSYIITDPYPNQSFYDSLPFHQKLLVKPPEHISVHRAYREGMEFMWSLIEPLLK